MRTPHLAGMKDATGDQAGEAVRKLLVPRLRPADAVVFDTDRVVTDTATVHAAAWKRAFDAVLREVTVPDPARIRPFHAVEDYRRYVDGKPRVEGAAAFLASRGIDLPLGGIADAPGRSSVQAIAACKDQVFASYVERYGVSVWPGTLRLVTVLRRYGIRVAAVSASRHARDILSRAKVLDLFDVVVDGRVCEQLQLAGKPAPALLWESARRLGVDRERTAVVEGTLPGVEAGLRGHFGLVVGVDRWRSRGHEFALTQAGADLVVQDPAELLVPPAGAEKEQARAGRRTA